MNGKLDWDHKSQVTDRHRKYAGFRGYLLRPYSKVLIRSAFAELLASDVYFHAVQILHLAEHFEHIENQFV